MTKTTATMFHTLISEARDILLYADNQIKIDKGDKALEQSARCEAFMDLVSRLHDQVLLNGKMVAQEYQSLLNQVSEIEKLLNPDEIKHVSADRSSGGENGSQTRSLFATTDGGW